VSGAEHRPTWLQGDAGGERAGINSVESEPIAIGSSVTPSP
jgi:hypothetical protein